MLLKSLIIYNCPKSQIKCGGFFSLFRSGHTMRGKPPGIALSLAKRLALENDTEVKPDVNIGFPRLRPTRTARHRLENNLNINEPVNRNLLINLEQVRKDNKIPTEYHVKRLAYHYGIYKDLFPNAYFVPRVPLSINFKAEDSFYPVHNGNIIQPSQASVVPDVEFDTSTDLLTGKESNEKTYWSLLLVNPDGCNETVQQKEYIHWFVSNIPNNNFGKGEIIVPYLQPIPGKGLGFQRFIFVLYKQETQIDFKNYQISDLKNLSQRLFSTEEFYRNYQDDITPAGLSFFQTIWDDSVTQIHHKYFNKNEQRFEYDIPKPYIAEQKWFPLKHAFNTYLDRYRSPQDLNKRILKANLKETHPFNGPNPRLRFPNAQPIKNTPSWLKYRMVKERLHPVDITSY